MRIKVQLSVEVDAEVWAQNYGPLQVDQRDDVCRYLGGLVAGAEATRRGAIVGVSVRCRPVQPSGDY